jgi:hypothetical protein
VVFIRPTHRNQSELMSGGLYCSMLRADLKSIIEVLDQQLSRPTNNGLSGVLLSL